MNCRVCNRPTYQVLDLGKMYPSNFIPKDVSSTEYFKYPLVLVKCEGCGLVQLKDTVELDDMYRQYWYRSGLNPSMKEDLKDVAYSTLDRLDDYGKGDVWLDIGCNDCTLFSYVPDCFYKAGFDPARNITINSDSKYDIVINDYFDGECITFSNAKVITSIAMFYDLPDPNSFVNDVKKVLSRKGIWVVQLTDLFGMLLTNAFDNICHEHLEYYTLQDIINIVEPHGLEVFDLEYNSVNGASLRAYICHKGDYEKTHDLLISVHQEKDMLKEEVFQIGNFKVRIDKLKERFHWFLEENKDKRIFGLGASTKGNTLLQYFEIDNTMLPYIAEVNEDKFGLKTIGSEIEIISEKKALELNPDYLVVFPWHFKLMLIKNLSKYLEGGGKLVFPLPYLTIVSKEGGHIYGIDSY